MNKEENTSNVEKQPRVKIFKYFDRQEVGLIEDPKNTKFDSKTNKIIDGTFNPAIGEEKIVLAHDNAVTPVYLIELKCDVSLNQVVKEMIYSKIEVKEFTRDTDIAAQLQSLDLPKGDENKIKQIPLDQLLLEIDKELDSNHEVKLECMMN